jgi:hypothetical protein
VGFDSTMSNNGAQQGVSATTNGYRTAQAQQRFAVVRTYTFNSSWDVSLAYSNVQYLPDIHSALTDTAIFNTDGIAVHWKPAATVDLAAGYSHTRARGPMVSVALHSINNTTSLSTTVSQSVQVFTPPKGISEPAEKR